MSQHSITHFRRDWCSLHERCAWYGGQLTSRNACAVKFHLQPREISFHNEQRIIEKKYRYYRYNETNIYLDGKVRRIKMCRAMADILAELEKYIVIADRY